MDAPSIVALAKKAADEIVASGYYSPRQRRRDTMYVAADGAWGSHLGARPTETYVLSAPLDAETTASPYALARALLKSAVVMVRDHKDFVAWISEIPMDGATRAEAVEALLDALLPAEATA